MPAIEILCVDQAAPLDVSRYPFAIDSSPQPVSPRNPRPLFREDLKPLKGFRYQLGNPFFRSPQTDGAFNAQGLLSPWCRSQSEILEFEEAVSQSIYDLLATALAASPRGRVIFVSDDLHCPSQPCKNEACSLQQFWGLHQRRQLKLNAWYELKAEVKKTRVPGFEE